MPWLVMYQCLISSFGFATFRRFGIDLNNCRFPHFTLPSDETWALSTRGQAFQNHTVPRRATYGSNIHSKTHT